MSRVKLRIEADPSLLSRVLSQLVWHIFGKSFISVLDKDPPSNVHVDVTGKYNTITRIKEQ